MMTDIDSVPQRSEEDQQRQQDSQNEEAAKCRVVEKQSSSGSSLFGLSCPPQTRSEEDEQQEQKEQKEEQGNNNNNNNNTNGLATTSASPMGSRIGTANSSSSCGTGETPPSGMSHQPTNQFVHQHNNNNNINQNENEKQNQEGLSSSVVSSSQQQRQDSAASIGASSDATCSPSKSQQATHNHHIHHKPRLALPTADLPPRQQHQQYSTDTESSASTSQVTSPNSSSYNVNHHQHHQQQNNQHHHHQQNNRRGSHQNHHHQQYFSPTSSSSVSTSNRTPFTPGEPGMNNNTSTPIIQVAPSNMMNDSIATTTNNNSSVNAPPSLNSSITATQQQQHQFVNTSFRFTTSDKNNNTTTTYESIDSLQDLTLLDYIGRGATAHVQKAYHERTKKYLAVKMIDLQQLVEVDQSSLPSRGAGKGGQVRQLRFNVLRELHMLHAQYRSNHVLKMYEAFFHQTPDRTKAALYIVTEFMDYGNLVSLADALGPPKSELRRNPIPERVLAVIAEQMLLGLQEMHSKSHIHRDIKPQNVLVNAQGAVKLSDFGLTVDLVSATGASTIDNFMASGTEWYMAPERIRGEAHGAASDIWSLGLTIAECAIGRFPFHRKGMAGQSFEMLKAVSEPVKYPPDLAPFLSEDFKNFVSQCLQVNPKKRPSASQLLQHKLIGKWKNEFPFRQWLKKEIEGRRHELKESSVQHKRSTALKENFVDHYEMAVHAAPPRQQQHQQHQQQQQNQSTTTRSAQQQVSNPTSRSSSVTQYPTTVTVRTPVSQTGTSNPSSSSASPVSHQGGGGGGGGTLPFIGSPATPVGAGAHGLPLLNTGGLGRSPTTHPARGTSPFGGSTSSSSQQHSRSTSANLSNRHSHQQHQQQQQQQSEVMSPSPSADRIKNRIVAETEKEWKLKKEKEQEVLMRAKFAKK